MEKCNKLVQSVKDASHDVKFGEKLFLYVQPKKIPEYVCLKVFDLPSPIQVHFDLVGRFDLIQEDSGKKDEFDGPSYKIYYSFNCRRPNS